MSTKATDSFAAMAKDAVDAGDVQYGLGYVENNPSPKPRKTPMPTTATAGPSRKFRAASDLLKQVSDPTRLQVLMTLAESERNVSELCVDVGGLSQPATSHHLCLLRHGGLIEPRRSGKNNVYSLTDKGRSLVTALSSLVA